MDHFWRDVRYAARTLARAPTFTLVAVGTLALGIGANTAIFSVVNGVLLRELPYDEPERLVNVWLDMTRRDGPLREWFTPQDLVDYRAEPGLFEAMAAWGGWTPTLTGIAEPEVITAAVITQGMFEEVLRVPPRLGRGFVASEDAPGAAGSVLLSHAFWQERLGGDPAVLGRSVLLDETPFTVVGVMPEDFRPPFVPDAELWAPARLDPASCGRGCYTIRAIARLAPGLTLDAARERADALAARLAEAYPDTHERVGAVLFDLREDLVGTTQRALWVLFGAVGFVLLIACLNVANLLLARGAGREGELAVRAALGAGRASIVRQMLTESLLLATLGGAVGLALAGWVTDALIAATPVTLPGVAEVGVDGRVLAFTAAVALGTGLLFGMIPAVRAGYADVYGGLRRTTGGARRGGRLADGLVVSQVALALMLLVGAGLLGRSFQRLTGASLGFDPEGVLTVSLALPASRYDEAFERTAYYGALLERLRAMPGVVSAAATNSLPLAGNDGDANFRIEGAPPPEPTQEPVAWIRRITGGYFTTMRQELVAGRDFNAMDGAGAPNVVIVNETLARRHFGDPPRDALGKRVAFGGGPDPIWRTIVGVVADTRHFGIRDGTRPAMYFPYEQVPSLGMSVVMRTAGDPAALAPEARAAVSDVDGALAASSVAPLSELVDAAVVNDRFVTGLLGAFALLALVLAAVGLYGLVSYGVTRRMREMGIRLALGAGDHHMLRLVLGGGLGLTGVGVALGVIGSLALTRVLGSLLYGVSATDPATFGAVVAVLSGVAVAASWIPAHRARRADPVTVLRQE
jgi:predicted permease